MNFHRLKTWSPLNLFSFICLLAISPITALAVNGPVTTNNPFAGTWAASLKCPGGEIEFQLELAFQPKHFTGFIVNGTEKIKIERVAVEKDVVRIEFPHYDSFIEAKLVKENQLKGTWTKVVGKDKQDVLSFQATRGKRKFNNADGQLIAGRYSVRFESSTDMAVGKFQNQKEFLAGTFLTTTGDYRYLAGSYQRKSNELKLSCFDGGHAFLFRAKRGIDGGLEGDFWSRSSWHEKWTGIKNSQATIDDGFKQVEWAGVKTSQLEFPDLNGKTRALNDKAFQGKVKIVQVFGSWCPNCHDASVFLNELKKSYESRGLKVVGLAFELTGDFARDRNQILRYKKRTGADYPILIAGIADKKKATKQLRILSQVKSYPTTIFLDQNDKPLAIHSGFTGPATGDAYEALKKKFIGIIEKQLER